MEGRDPIGDIGYAERLAKKHGCVLVTQELYDDLLHQMSENRRRRDVMTDAVSDLFWIGTTLDGVRYVLLRSRLRRVRSRLSRPLAR